MLLHLQVHLLVELRVVRQLLVIQLLPTMPLLLNVGGRSVLSARELRVVRHLLAPLLLDALAQRVCIRNGNDKHKSGCRHHYPGGGLMPQRPNSVISRRSSCSHEHEALEGTPETLESPETPPNSHRNTPTLTEF